MQESRDRGGKMNARKWSIVSGIAVLVMLALVVGLTQAQGPEQPEGEVGAEGEVGVAAVVGDGIPIQGRLTDTGGNPLADGDYGLNLRLYDSLTGGTVLCEDYDLVDVEDGLFSTYMNWCTSSDIDGKQLYLGVQVEGDPEMEPRQGIYPVPYAFSLRPGAEIKGDLDDDPILYAYNTGSGPGVWATSLEDDGIHAASWAGSGVYGSSLTGVGVRAYSLAGTAIRADGAISSTADTQVVVSPLNMVPDWESGSDLGFRPTGVYMEVRPGASASTAEYVQIPVDLPSVLFGTRTKLRRVRICYRCDQAASFVNTTIVSQGRDSGTANNIINDTTDRTSTDWECYSVTASPPESITGSVYIRLSLSFDGTGAAHDIRIGNITVTLTEE
jgi:hypothetical protein